MSSGDQGFDTTEFTAGPENRDRMAAGYKTPNEQRQSYLFCSAFNYASPSIMKRIEVLRGIQSKHDEVKAEFLKERAKLEAKYQTLYQYFYAKRYHIVNGLVEVDGDQNKGTDSEDNGEKGIPNFWLIAMKNNDVIADEIFEKDEGALGYLKDIKWRRIENPKGFRLDFFFNTNPYFKNTVLTKIYYMIDEDEPILKNAIGTKIEWHPGNCLALRIEKEPNTAVGLEERQSFFDFFNPPQVPARRWDVDDDTADKLQKKMEQDYDVATTIRDKIIPHAVSWFTGEADGIAYSSDEDEDDDDDDDDEEQDDEDSFDE